MVRVDFDGEQGPTAFTVLVALGKALASIAGVVAALSILPAIPYAFVAGMETNRSAGTLLAAAPLLFAISTVAAVFCVARFTVFRFALAVIPVTLVFASWLI